MTDYSQNGEQAYILRALGLYLQTQEGQDVDIRSLDSCSKRFLDIGSWNATIFSNTRALYELGWGGVLIEPSPGPLKGLIAEYGNDPKMRIIGAAVTVEGGMLELEVTDDAVTMPISDHQRREEWRSVAGFYGKLSVPAISVRDLLTKWTDGAFEFVSIDTEGTSCDVFAEMLTVGVRPRCVCVEHDNRFVELSQHAEAGNYQLVHENGTNRVYRWMGPQS